MKTNVLNYHVIVKPDVETGTGKPGFTAFCPTLGVADGGDTVEEAIQNIKGAIQAYVASLEADSLPVPTDNPSQDILTQVSLPKPKSFNFVWNGKLSSRKTQKTRKVTHQAWISSKTWTWQSRGVYSPRWQKNCYP